MSLSHEHIIRHLFRVGSLEEVSRRQLEELVEEYPSFGVGRYLLSRKLQAETAEHFNEETQKTNLYFTNPFWLQWLLRAEDRPVTEEQPLTPPEEQPLAQPEEWNAAGEAELPAEEVFAPVVDPTEPTVGPSAADELLKSIAEFQEQRRAEQASVTPEEESPSMGIAGLALERIEEEEVPVEAGIPEAETETSPEVAPPVQEVPVEATIPKEQEAPPVEATAETIASSQNHTPEKAPAGSTQEPVFEPYYTVDYFASQGIRLVVDENPTDRLGMQMKSFTDWLKVMRRLPQKNREIIPDIAAEHQVQAIAAHSIERGEVITETMAEVLAKQGMREKATEMYRKLSLLEPEKSAYFAEKIEQLKII